MRSLITLNNRHLVYTTRVLLNMVWLLALTGTFSPQISYYTLPVIKVSSVYLSVRPMMKCNAHKSTSSLTEYSLLIWATSAAVSSSSLKWPRICVKMRQRRRHLFRRQRFRSEVARIPGERLRLFSILFALLLSCRIFMRISIHPSSLFLVKISPSLAGFGLLVIITTCCLHAEDRGLPNAAPAEAQWFSVL